MKRLYPACLAVLGLAACADHMDPLEYEGEPIEHRLAPTYAVLPDAAPGFELMSPYDPQVETPSLRVSLMDSDACGYAVISEGLPAVSDDGHRVVHIWNEPPGNADGFVLGSSFVTTTFDSADEPHAVELPLLEGWNERFDDPSVDFDGQCRAYATRLRERVETYNAKLEGYRPMAPLDVVADSRPEIGMDSPLDVLDPESLPGGQRPVVARWRAGWLTLRVPGVAVLFKDSREQWLRPDDFCDDVPHVQGIYADRETGRALVWVNYISGACLCDDGEYLRPITLPAEVFDAVDAFPSAPYFEALEVGDGDL